MFSSPALDIIALIWESEIVSPNVYQNGQEHQFSWNKMIYLYKHSKESFDAHAKIAKSRQFLQWKIY